MLTNPVINSMFDRRSVRKYSHRRPIDDVISSVVRAGQQPQFVSQLCSLLLSRNQLPGKLQLYLPKETI